MSDIKKTFHEMALESILFKGQSDWYFCFLKSERIAHVMAVLDEKVVHNDKQWFEEIVQLAAQQPYKIAHFVAGDIDVQTLLADIFSLLASIRISVTRGYISKETALYIINEYERIAEKLATANKPSPFVTSEDFAIPEVRPPKPTQIFSFESGEREHEKPTSHSVSHSPKGQFAAPTRPKEMGDRSTAILNFVLQNKAVSIKDICSAVTGCSEKTVQRELTNLIAKGLIKREGERRWSVYKPA